MSHYSIKDVEQLSGIKAHTLRIWEQRYNFLKPKRTNTNIRYYDDEDLKLLLNISLLKENGHKLSNICRMRGEDMHNEVKRLLDRSFSFPEQIQALTMGMLDMDEDRFDKILSTNILKLGFERTMMNIVYPFFHKVGILWQTGSISVAQEHFISNLVRQKIIVAIDGQMISSNEYNDKYMLFLPENEMHELSLLFSSYLLKSRNNKVIYLGQNVPVKDLEVVYKAHQPQYLVTVFTSYPSSDDVQAYINHLSITFGASQILISGNQVLSGKVNCPSNVLILNKIQDLISFIEQ